MDLAFFGVASPGEAAYRGYFAKCEGKSLVSGAPLPLWNDQALEIREAWESAAEAVLAL